jgi:hypothetical protein
VGASSNESLMSDGPSLLCMAVAMGRQCQPIAAVGASSNGLMMSDNSSLLWVLVAMDR